MKRRRFIEEQIIKNLKKHESGIKMPELVRKDNVSEQSIYRSKSKFGGMDASDVKKLKQLESENARLKPPIGISCSLVDSRSWRSSIQDTAIRRYMGCCVQSN